jgi:hypothetical protein
MAPLTDASHSERTGPQIAGLFSFQPEKFPFGQETGMIAFRLSPLDCWRSLLMKGWISAALVAGVMVFASPASVTTAAAGPQRTVAQKADAGATDFSARRYYRRYDRHYGYGSSYAGFYYRPYPSYYGRPDYYQPYPYYAPYAYGFRFGPLVW